MTLIPSRVLAGSEEPPYPSPPHPCPPYPCPLSGFRLASEVYNSAASSDDCRPAAKLSAGECKKDKKSSLKGIATQKPSVSPSEKVTYYFEKTKANKDSTKLLNRTEEKSSQENVIDLTGSENSCQHSAGHLSTACRSPVYHLLITCLIFPGHCMVCEILSIY